MFLSCTTLLRPCHWIYTEHSKMFHIYFPFSVGSGLSLTFLQTFFALLDLNQQNTIGVSGNRSIQSCWAQIMCCALGSHYFGKYSICYARTMDNIINLASSVPGWYMFSMSIMLFIVIYQAILSSASNGFTFIYTFPVLCLFCWNTLYYWVYKHIYQVIHLYIHEITSMILWLPYNVYKHAKSVPKIYEFVSLSNCILYCMKLFCRA